MIGIKFLKWGNYRSLSSWAPKAIISVPSQMETGRFDIGGTGNMSITWGHNSRWSKRLQAHAYSVDLNFSLELPEEAKPSCHLMLAY